MVIQQEMVLDVRDRFLEEISIYCLYTHAIRFFKFTLGFSFFVNYFRLPVFNKDVYKFYCIKAIEAWWMRI
jgi:hypothetical protein